jgi:hypothetical protein
MCCDEGGVAPLSGGLGAGREPGVAVEEVAEGVELADAPFRGGGQVRLEEGELGESFEGPPAATGAAMLDLDRPDCPLGLVAGTGPPARLPPRSPTPTPPACSAGPN